MEYDRALYRVYEKVLEDLMQTRPIFQPEIQQETNILQEDQQHAINGSSIHRRTNNSIPFLWPLFIIRYADIVNRSYYGEWRRLSPHTNHTNNGNMDMDMDMDSNIDTDTHTNRNMDMDIDTDMDSIASSRPSRLWSILRRNRAGNRSSTFSRVAIEENDTDLEEGEGSRNGTGTGIRNHRVDVEMTSLSQNTGLRRRNNSSSSSRESNASSEDQNSNPNVRSQGTIWRQHEESDELNDVERTNIYNDNISGNGNGNNDSDNENEISNAQTETTRMAQHIAQRQRSEEERQAEEVVRACSQKGLFAIMRICMCVAVFHLVVLACLHRTYIGPRIAKHIAIIGDSDGDGIGERMTCLEYALSTRPERDRSQFFRVFGEEIDTDEENKEGIDAQKVSKSAADEKSFIAMASHDINKTAPLLGRDEILQIKIIYGDNCKKMPGRQCSRVHTVIASTNSTEYIKESKWDQIGLADNEVEPDGVSQYSSAVYWSEPVYKFSANEALMFLDKKMISFHNISIVNVTLSERCLSTGSDDGVYHSISTKFAQFLSQIYGIDAIIVNQLMYGIKNTDGKYLNGHLQNVESKARWTYSGSYLEAEKEILHNFATWCYNRIGVFVISFLAFSLVTSVSALIVRLLTSSGVMALFPLFAALRVFGLNGVDERVLNYSYPWVGRARSAIQRQGIHPMKHYIAAHLAKLFLVYTMYESCQIAWSEVLYGKSIPANLPLWIFGNAMVYEYFSMVFVRSALR
jgi:hypothetical protein